METRPSPTVRSLEVSPNYVKRVTPPGVSADFSLECHVEGELRTAASYRNFGGDRHQKVGAWESPSTT